MTKGNEVGVLQGNVWVELVGQIIIARLRGDVSVEMLNERHQRICQIRRDTSCSRVLLDDLEMTAMSYPAVEVQQALNIELESLDFQIAIVVPNSRLAYLARIQFGDINHRVFYNDMAEATAWLMQSTCSALPVTTIDRLPI